VKLKTECVEVNSQGNADKGYEAGQQETCKETHDTRKTEDMKKSSG
jgi:hypothetical protein